MKPCNVMTQLKTKKVNCKNKPFGIVNGDSYCRKHIDTAQGLFGALTDLNTNRRKLGL